jgi:glycosyltransferase involved in cell wall biosynthesis
MTQPLVSVKMITYNHAPYIAQAIEGVLQQKTNFPFELVIGEDCSTDGTREIVFKYPKKYPNIIRVITSDANVGMKKNSYRTTKACRGKYVAFCEGDDYWHHVDKLQKQFDYMESHPGCGLVSADCDIYYNGSNKFKRSFNYNRGFQSPANFSIEQVLFQEGAWIWTCTVMIRRNLYEQVIQNDLYLYQNEQLFVGDLQIWAEMTLLSEVTYIPETLATYRVLDESASRSKDPRKYLRFKKSLFDIKLYLCDKYKLSANMRRTIERVWCDCSLRLAFYERNADLAMEVRKKNQVFTCKELLLYYGAKYWAIHYGFRTAVLFRNLFREVVKTVLRIEREEI